MKKTIAIVLAIACALAVFVGCTRSGAYYYPGTFVAQDNNYCLGPSVSVVNGTLAVQTIGLTNVYTLKTACPINVSNNNITVNNIAMFQLTGCGPNVAPYIGSPVRLTGKFFLGCAENNCAQLLMEVSKFEVYNTVPVSQCNAQISAQCNVQSYAQSNVQSSAQGYEQGYTQGYTQGYEQGNAQGKTQSSAQGGTQINTQINAQGNAQVNAQINIQNNTQSKAQSASKPAPAAQKPRAGEPVPAAKSENLPNSGRSFLRPCQRAESRDAVAMSKP